MKRIIFLVTVVSLAVFLCAPRAEAAFGIDLNFYSIDFGSLNMGDTKDDVPAIGLTVTCTTDQLNPWSLKIRNESPFTHTLNPSSTIPNTDLYWYGISTSVPGNNSLVTSQQDFTIERTVYSAPGSEGSPGTQIILKFRVDIPTPTQAGSYTTRIVFTFTE